MGLASWIMCKASCGISSKQRTWNLGSIEPFNLKDLENFAKGEWPSQYSCRYPRELFKESYKNHVAAVL